MLNVDAVKKRLPPLWRLQWQERVTSTNDLALQWARAGEPEGLVVGAETQTRGRGRRGRRWLDVPGQCLLFSVLLRPPAPLRPLIGLTAAVAVADACRRFAAPLRLRWPNDLYWRSRKVCGILTETAGGATAVGIGINVGRLDGLPPELAAASVSQIAGRFVSREDLLAATLTALAERYETLRGGGASEIVAAARQIDGLAGRHLVVRLGSRQVAGRCLGIDPAGRLVLDSPAGPLALTAGEVVHVREA